MLVSHILATLQATDYARELLQDGVSCACDLPGGRAAGPTSCTRPGSAAASSPCSATADTALLGVAHVPRTYNKRTLRPVRPARRENEEAVPGE